MSAITGSGDPFTISLSASAASRSGTAGRTISQPASFSSWIWRSVALTSRVSVLVMVCTAIGAAPPMTTPPTLTGIDFRRVTTLVPSGELARGNALDVEKADQRGEAQQRSESPALDVELAPPVERPAAQPLQRNHDDATAVEGRNRKQVREAEGDRKKRDQQDVIAWAPAHGLVGDGCDADWAGEPLRAKEPARNLSGDESIETLGDAADRQERKRHAIRDRGLRGQQPLDADPDVTRRVARVAYRRDHVRERFAVRVDAAEDERRSGGGLLLLLDFARRVHRLSVHGLDAVSDLHPGHGSGRCGDHPDDLARDVVELCQAETGCEQHRHQEVGGRAGGQDGDPLQRGLGMEAV